MDIRWRIMKTKIKRYIRAFPVEELDNHSFQSVLGKID